MEEQQKVINALRKVFTSASDIYVDTQLKECEVRVDIAEFIGEISHVIHEGDISLRMEDYNDILPFKYVFSYRCR